MTLETSEGRILIDATEEARAKGLRGQVYLTAAALAAIRPNPVALRNCMGDLAFCLSGAEYSLRRARKVRGPFAMHFQTVSDGERTALRAECGPKERGARRIVVDVASD